MKAVINGVEKQIASGLTITTLLAAEEVKRPEMVSVELNEVILDRNQFSSTLLKEGDRIEFLYFMGGGA